jgi:inner membrane protein involved in colicin E2 resistance
MNCFYHSQNPAVALCKNCSKGLCSECAIDQGYGVACKGRCEEEVKSIWQIIQRSKSAYQKTAGAYFRNALFTGSAGLVFFLFSYLLPNTSPEMSYLFRGVAAVFFLGMFLSLISARRIKKV